MNRKISITELSGALAQRTGTDKATASALLRNFFATIAGGLEKDSLVKVKGFATFKTLVVEERESVDVNTGERISIGSHAKISFTPDATLKALVNRPFSHFKTITLNEETSSEELEEVDRRMSEELESVREEVPEVENVSDVAESHESVTASVKEDDEHTEMETKSDETAAASPVEIAAPEDGQKTGAQESETEQAAEPDKETETSEAKPADEQSENLDSEEHTKDDSDCAEEEETSDEEPEQPKRHVVLKWFGALFLSILLFAAGYLTGCFFPYNCQTDLPEVRPTQSEPAQTAPDVRPDSTPILITPADSAAPVGPAPAVSETQITSEPKEEKPQPAALPKHPAGNVSIVGTQGVHTLKIGEDLTHLALQYYGSKDYVRYIIQHNELENPNIVHVGTKLKMPKLKVE